MLRQSSHTWRRVKSSVSKCVSNKTCFLCDLPWKAQKVIRILNKPFDDLVNLALVFRRLKLVRSRGGKRRGSGRKRKHEEGYENVRSSLWKTISLHANVYEEWMALRTAHNFKENSAFAQFLLKRAANAATDAEMTFRSDISTQAAGLER